MTSKRVRGERYTIRLASKDWGPRGMFEVESGAEGQAQVWSQWDMAMVAAQPGPSLTRRLRARVKAIQLRQAEWDIQLLRDTRPEGLPFDRVGPHDRRWGLGGWGGQVGR